MNFWKWVIVVVTAVFLAVIWFLSIVVPSPWGKFWALGAFIPFGMAVLYFWVYFNSSGGKKERGPIRVYHCEKCGISWTETALKRRHVFCCDTIVLNCPNCGERVLEIIQAG